ncbi:MAG: hypothetical protein K5872_08005 [Rhizobiaceae bacterium]|nr:hypothetical protein [Rhizobiaceae bacterium]MCV0406156.1 hypothetical protein [Rhizobiaceae bacterium]
MRTSALRRASTILALAASGALVAGCIAGPTYGTAKGSHEQLLEDVSGILSVGPKEGERIDYKARPELVRSPELAKGQLPPPQESVATASNGAWPESPEARRARLRAEATAFRDEPDFRPGIEGDEGDIRPSTRSQRTVLRTKGDDVPLDGRSNDPVSQRDEFNRRLAENRQGSPTTRKYLSEPPLAYRQPSETAPTGDVGVAEWRKERDAKRAARKNDKRSWADILPW